MDIILHDDSAHERPVLKDTKPPLQKSYKYYRPHSEQVMVDRMLRTKATEQKEIEYEFTKDPGLLHQYYMLRENMFINVWGLKEFSGNEDAYDRYSHILVARQGNQCIGGVRLTIKSQSSLRRLPLEADDFILDKVLPEFRLSECRYGEFSRFAVLPELRKGCPRELSRRIILKAIASNVQFVFAIAPVSQARTYRFTAISLGLDNVIRDDIPVPDREEYEGIPMCLTYLDLRQACESYNKQAAFHEPELTEI